MKITSTIEQQLLCAYYDVTLVLCILLGLLNVFLLVCLVLSMNVVLCFCVLFNFVYMFHGFVFLCTLQISGSLARKAIRELMARGSIRMVSSHASQQIYTRATNT